jgi:DNA repair protein RadC
MRARVEQYGLDSLAEHEALEYVLFFAIPRQDTNPIAHALMEHFGSFANVLEAAEDELCTVPGIGPAAAHFLHSLPEIDRYFLLSRNGRRTKLSTTQEIAAYLAPHFRGAGREKLAMLALDDRSRLLRLVWLDDGSAGALDVSVRKVATAAATAGAAGVVLAHNHPDGIVLPSKEDLMATRAAAQALSLLEIRLIFAGEEWLSLKDSGRMPAAEAARCR